MSNGRLIESFTLIKAIVRTVLPIQCACTPKGVSLGVKAQIQMSMCGYRPTSNAIRCSDQATVLVNCWWPEPQSLGAIVLLRPI